MNSILKKGILGFFILAFLLAPVSFGVFGTVQVSNVFAADCGGGSPDSKCTCSSETQTKTVILTKTGQQNWWCKNNNEKGGLEAVKEAVVNVAVEPLLNSIAGTLLGLTGGVLTMSGMFLNEVVEKTIVGMSEIVNQLTGIKSAWSTIRDVINMTFIFILLYASIQIILRRGGYTVQSILIKVIIAALLINFSLFVVRFVADVSNTVTVFLYEPIIQSIPEGVTVIDIYGAPDIRALGISSVFMKELDLQSVFDGDDVGKAFVYQILGAIFFLITAFVFFAIALMFVARFIIFIILMITAPIGFVGGLLPGFSGYSKQWLEALAGQATFPPIFMLMVLMIFRIMRGVDGKGGISAVLKSGGDNGFAQSFSGGSTLIIINFAIIIGLLIMALIIAKTTASKGTGKIVSGVTKWGGAAVLGGGALIGRRTIGASANVLAQNRFLNEKAETSRFARLALRGAQGTATSSFDIRSARVPGTKIGFEQLGKTTGIDLGKAQKGGYVHDAKNTKKARVEKLKKFEGAATKETLKDLNTAKSSVSEHSKEYLRGVAKGEIVEGEAIGEVLGKKGKGGKRANGLVDTISALEKDLFKKQEELATLSSAPGVDTSALDAEVKKIEADLKQKQEKLSELRDSTAFKHESAGEMVAELQKKVGDEKKRSQARYLESAERTGGTFVGGVGPYASTTRAAVADLRKTRGKTKRESALDTLKDELEKADKNKDDDADEKDK